MARRIAALIAAVSSPLAVGMLKANDAGAPQDMTTLGSSAANVCAGRSSECSVLLDVPLACATATADEVSRCPVVFGFHGFGGSNSQWLRSSQAIHDMGFIGVYPQGDPLGGKHAWNDGQEVVKGTLQCPWDNFDCQKDANDLDFTATIAAAVRDLAGQGRMYSYGHSNGADHSQRVGVSSVANATALPFFGIAADSGPLMVKPARSGPGPYNYNHFPDALDKGRYVAELSIHGDADAWIPFEGGPKFGNETFVMASTPLSNKWWSIHNHCSDQMTNTTIPATFSGTSETVAFHFEYTGCPATAPVEYYQVVGAGHCATSTLDGENLDYTVLKFFSKVDAAWDELVRGGAIAV